MNVNFCPSREKMPKEIRKCRDLERLDSLRRVCKSCLYGIFEDIPGYECRTCEVRERNS